jgi:hypothetical protein
MTDPVIPVAPRATEILREVDSYRATIRTAFEEAFALSKLEGSLSAAWERSEARQVDAAFALTRIGVGAIVRELLAAAPVPWADPWQPIETAPKDTPVLVALIRDGKVMRVSDAKRNSVGFYSINGGIACHWRTHWMPMPRATGEGDGHQQTIETPPPTTGEVWGKTTASADSWAIGIGSSQAATVAPRRDPSAEAAPVAVSLGLPEALAAFIDVYGVVFDEDDVVMLQAVLARLRGEATVRLSGAQSNKSATLASDDGLLANGAAVRTDRVAPSGPDSER